MRRRIQCIQSARNFCRSSPRLESRTGADPAHVYAVRGSALGMGGSATRQGMQRTPGVSTLGVVRTNVSFLRGFTLPSPSVRETRPLGFDSHLERDRVMGFCTRVRLPGAGARFERAPRRSQVRSSAYSTPPLFSTQSAALAHGSQSSGDQNSRPQPRSRVLKQILCSAYLRTNQTQKYKLYRART